MIEYMIRLKFYSLLLLVLLKHRPNALAISYHYSNFHCLVHIDDER